MSVPFCKKIGKEREKVSVPFLMGFLLLSGCASISTFHSYTSQLNPYIECLRENKILDLKKELANKVNSRDKILYLMERGRIAQIQGDFDTSKSNFKAAIQAIKEDDQKAVVSAWEVAAQISSVMVNDNAIPYKGDGYERIMLYHFQAMNYLADNDIEGAGVEARRANVEQKYSLKHHNKEIEQAREMARKQRVYSTMPSSVTNAYAGMDHSVGSVKSSFQNAYTFYLSGIIYEMLGNPNDAYIDYKKAIEIFPENIYLQKDVFRLAKQLNMKNDADNFKSRYPKIWENLSQVKANAGELILLYEDDFVAQKKQIKIPIPISTEITFTGVAFPRYNIKKFSPAPLELSEGGNLIGTTELICSVNALAVKSLKEKVPAIVIRQIIRSTAKAAAVKTAQEKGGLMGSLVGSIYNIASENADLRSWVTLPADMQIMRVSLPTGKHEFVLAQKDSGAFSNIKVNIKENRKNIIWVIRTGNKLYCKIMS